MGPFPQKPPKMGPKKLIFLIAQARVIVFVYSSRYLSDKCFDIVWGYHLPRDPQIRDVPIPKFLLISMPILVEMPIPMPIL